MKPVFEDRYICTGCGELLKDEDLKRQDGWMVREVMCPDCDGRVEEADALVAIQTAKMLAGKIQKSKTPDRDWLAISELLDWAEETL